MLFKKFILTDLIQSYCYFIFALKRKGFTYLLFILQLQKLLPLAAIINIFIKGLILPDYRSGSRRRNECESGSQTLMETEEFHAKYSSIGVAFIHAGCLSYSPFFAMIPGSNIVT